MTSPTAVPPADVVATWLRRLPGFESSQVLSIELAEGGASNITCRVAVDSAPFAAVALRLQRERGIFEPYDVLREARLTAALAPAGIPVPALLGTEKDPSLLGGPFAVYEWIDAPHFGEAGAHADFGAFTAMVATIHALPWASLGLDMLEPPADSAMATARELDSIGHRMESFAISHEPLLIESLARLRAAIPASGDLTLCQGDINVFNYLFRDGRVVGVVDWEQAHIGDPMSDIGQLVALSHLKGAPWGPAAQTGFAMAYGATSGRSLANLTYFRALWLLQLTVIHHGWVAFTGGDPWYTRADVTAMLERALDELPA